MDYHLITAFSIIIMSYNMQFLVFPAFAALEKRTNSRFAKASLWSIGIETVAYLLTGFLVVLMFAPDEIKADFLDNLALKTGAVSIIARVMFCLLLIFD